jgi:hypothetical protein
MIGLLRCAWRDGVFKWIDEDPPRLPWPLPAGIQQMRPPKHGS